MKSFPPFSPGSWTALISFCLIVGLVLVVQYFYLNPLKTQVGRRYLFVSILWIAIVSLSAALGWTRHFFPVSIPIIILPTFAILLYFAKAGIGESLASKPEKALILAAGFRFPLELVLYSWSQTRTIPETMTWTGANWDIVPGIMAFLVLIPAFNKAWFHRLFILVSTAMLINVMRVVLMSVNLPFSWELKDPIQLIFEWPYCLIAVILVPWAIMLNIALGWRIMEKEK